MATTASTTQQEANRANAQLSTGPRTEQGKFASSSNSRTHGLTTRQALLPTEDPSEHEQHHADYLAHYRPKNAIAKAAVVELADLLWRLRRVASFEAQLITSEIVNPHQPIWTSSRSSTNSPATARSSPSPSPA